MEKGEKHMDSRLCAVLIEDDGTVKLSEARWNRGRREAQLNRSASANDTYHCRTHYTPERRGMTPFRRLLMKLGIC